MDSLFVMAAGGTGAKVVESLVHLCAAGFGPDRLDVLLLDVDQSNGNVDRARETAELYARLRAWDWTLSPQSAVPGGRVPLAGTRLFKTDVALHVSLDPIQTVGNGGLRVNLRNEPGAYKLLNLLYNESEQGSQCEKGFLARPNLGSLVLGGHLRERFAADGGAADFKARLVNALSAAPAGRLVPLAVAGSIFGGTGASLFPVVCPCVEEAIRPPNGGSAGWDKVAPAAVMLTPYFLPNQDAQPDGTETVDPSRFLADTANTLKHYGRTDALKKFKSVYLIGSDQPEVNRLLFVDGARDQANPPFIEEVVAALAILHAGRQPDGGTARTRIYYPPDGHVDWSNLPFAEGGQAQLALLLELAAFLLLPAKAGQPLSGGLLDACEQWSADFELLPWYERLLGGWARANFSHAYGPSRRGGGGWQRLADENILKGDAAASRAVKPLAEYAYRLLLWARTALPDAGPHRLVRMGVDIDYAAVWEVMCGLSAGEIEPAPASAGPKDNALVRLARAAAAALAKLAANQVPRRGIVTPLAGALPGFPGQGREDTRACALPVNQNALEDLAQRRGIPAAVHEKFIKTEVPAT